METLKKTDSKISNYNDGSNFYRSNINRGKKLFKDLDYLNRLFKQTLNY